MWIPANITIEDDHLFALTNDMAGRSPTFRNRLLQIGAEQTLRARIRSNRLRIPTIALTQTAFAINVQGWLFADIQIPPAVLFGRDNIKMIAHEIEHVIEQMEGLDLRALARRRLAGVRRLGEEQAEIFETDRATAFGHTVEREFRGQTAGSVCPRESGSL